MTDSSLEPRGHATASTTAAAMPRGDGPRAALAHAIPRRPRVTWAIGLVLALLFALMVTPSITADRWLAALGAGHVTTGERAPMTVRVAAFAGYDGDALHLGAGGIVVARGDVVDRDHAAAVQTIEASTPRGAAPYITFLVLAFALGALFTVHTRRSNRGRLLRVQLVSLGLIAIACAAIKIALLATAVSVLAMPIAALALVPTLVLDRVVGLATGVLGALVVALLVPFDVGVSIVLLVQVATIGLVVAERPKRRFKPTLIAGVVATVLTGVTYPLLQYLTTGHLPTAELADPLRSAWVAAAFGPALATVLALPLLPLYELAVGEITHGRLIHLEDLSNPLLRQIAEKAPGTWQHSLMMANLAEIAANAIGANGRLVRVGAYYHDLGKSLQPKYFIENLDPGEASPHDNLPPEVSCDAIFAHVTEGLVAARRAGLHERIVDFMHMHHGNGVLEYFWSKAREQGNPKGLTVENFRYPGHPPQSRETAILAICDAVEAASRTLKKPDVVSIDSLVQRIVYGKLHLGQLDESGLSMSDLRQISDSLRETIKHANHGRIEYPWQKAQQDASASAEPMTSTAPRLDSLDRAARADSGRVAPHPAAASASASTTGARSDEAAFADTAQLRGPGASNLKMPAAIAPVVEVVAAEVEAPPAVPAPIDETALAMPRTRSSRQAAPMLAADRDLPNTAANAVRDAVEAAAARPIATKPGFALHASPTPAARKRAATLPPTTPLARRVPTVPPPAGRRSPTLPPTMAARAALLADDDSASSLRITAERPAAVVAIEADEPPPRRDDAAVTRPQLDSASVRSLPLRAAPSNPGLQLPPIDPPAPEPAAARVSASYAIGLADRIDAMLDSPGEFGGETPVVAPTPAELRALLGKPDTTRQLSVDEIEEQHNAAHDAAHTDPAIDLNRRAFSKHTHEVDPDDIESAVQIAPTAKRTGRIPNPLAIAKAKKPPE